MAKKFLNHQESFVRDGLEGLVMMAPNLCLVKGHQIVVRADLEEVKKAQKATILCGGGAGHEPSHAGFVGKGMLSGAVSGAVFASPPSSDIEEAILQLGQGGSGGVLLVVKNYTGDLINFGIAAERARQGGLEVATVVVNEDCALESENKMAGRRGLAGTILVYKIAGAMAEEGRALGEMARVAERLVASMGTIGVALTSCELPGAAKREVIPEGHVAVGMGVHGEPGLCYAKLDSAQAMARRILKELTTADSGTAVRLSPGDRVAVLVNNLGATTSSELLTMTREVVSALEEEFDVQVARAFAGPVMTSLNMAGVSVTLLRLEEDAWLNWLDAPTEAPAWRGVLATSEPSWRDRTVPSLKRHGPEEGLSSDEPSMTFEQLALLKRLVHAICVSLIAEKEALNDLDREAGDGDCGTSHARGAEALMGSLEDIAKGSVGQFFSRVSNIIENRMGGTSGGLYSIFFSAMAAQLRASNADFSLPNILAGFSRGISAMRAAGRARPGDRTVLDVMVPCEEFLTASVSAGQSPDLPSLVSKMDEWTKATRGMAARAGRASYVSKSPDSADPGAAAFTVMVGAVVGVLCGR